MNHHLPIRFVSPGFHSPSQWAASFAPGASGGPEFKGCCQLGVDLGRRVQARPRICRDNAVTRTRRGLFPLVHLEVHSKAIPSPLVPKRRSLFPHPARADNAPRSPITGAAESPASAPL